NMDIKITVPALDNKIFRASISNIAPFITPQTRNFIVKCQINEKKTSLRPGMFVYIDFVLEKRTNIFYLPYDVLTGGDSLWYVDENNRARSLTYSPVFGNDDYFQINSDIASNRFIIEGQSFLDDGQAVRVPGDL
nr:efflux RND transporter periplasmic adaptor subunit [Spirochaetaceae bacterium]